jgi:hypothetical protein
MAAWQYYNLNDGLEAWRPALQLGEVMRAVYEAATDHKSAADAFFRACAFAAASAEVVAALGRFHRDARFRVSVTHPDDNREFC